MMDAQELFDEIVNEQRELFDAGFCESIPLDDTYTIHVWRSDNKWYGQLTGELYGHIEGEYPPFMWILEYLPGPQLSDPAIIAKFGPLSYSSEVVEAAKEYLERRGGE